ncbi:MAG: extracellular solute-binding protein [Betaproteobacteria bacterium]|nr:extracellular solute-binding protein [Betaproteobacteria bacterium]
MKATESGNPFPAGRGAFAALARWALAAALAVASQAGAAGTDPYSDEAIARKDFRGITLNVLTLEKPVLGEPTALHAAEFAKLTGARLIVNHVPFDRFYQETLLGLRQNKYDVLFYGSMWVADVVPYLEPIPKEMLDSAQYLDVLPHYQSIARWGDTPYQVPIDGDRHYLQYRKDILENPRYREEFRRKAGRALEVPKTWPELQEIARFFQGRKLDDGRIISGISEVTVSDALLGNQFIKRAAPYAKHPAVTGGFYFDLETMEPLVNTPGWVAALEDFRAAQDLYPAGGRRMSFPEVIRSFGSGESVFSDSWDDPFIQAMEPGNPLRNRVGAALSPGSRRVWNRRAGRWDDFPDVNYVPYVVYGWTSGVPRSTPHKQAAFDFLGFYANRRNHRADMLVGRFGMNPFRASDLDVDFWVTRAGWSPAVARSYVDTLERMANSRSRVLDLRIHRGQEYLYHLSVGVYRAITGRDSPQAALDAVAERWRKLTQQVGIDKQREAYRHLVRFEDGR